MLTKFETKSKRVKGLSFHPTRPWVLASLHTGVIQLWDYRIRTFIDKFDEHDGPVRGVCFHQSQPLFVSGGDDYKIKVWNYKQRRCLFTLLGHLDYIRTVQFHHEHPWILSASDDQTIRIWNWQSRTCVSVLTGHNHYVMCAQFHPKENLVVSASLDQTVRVWDVSGLRKKSYAPASAEDGARMPQNDLFGNTDVVVLHVMEGHDRGVNWAAFHPEDPLVVSGADDRHVKFWRLTETKWYEVDTLRGHLSNVSCAMFHPRKPLILSNSEDKTIRVWDVTRRISLKIFRRDQDKDRFWVLAAHPEQNLFAAGHDSGLIVFKLEHERPAYCVHGDTVYYVKERFLHAYNFRQGKHASLGAVRRKRGLDCAPRHLHYNPAEDALLVLTDQAYDLYQLPRGGAKDLGEPKNGANAGCFVARNRFAVLSPVYYKVLVKDLANQVTKEVELPREDGAGNALYYDRIWPASTGSVLLREYARSVVLLDLQRKKVTARVAAPNVKFAIWSSSDKDARVALLGRDVLVLANRQLEASCTVHDVRMKSGAWHPSGVFLYTTLTHLKFCLPNGDTGIIRTLDVPIFLVAAQANVVHCLDRACRTRAFTIDPTEFLLKLAVVQGDYHAVLALVRKFGLLGQAIIAYLQQKGYPELALHFVRDERTRFNLAMDCGDVETALEAAKAVDDTECWRRLGEEALRQGNHQVVETAYQRTRAYERLSFLYLVTGNTEKLAKMLKIAQKRGDAAARFHNALFLGDVEERVAVLRETGQHGLAYLAASAFGLDEAAAAAAAALEAAGQRLPPPPAAAALLQPPPPVTRLGDVNWPLLAVQKPALHQVLQDDRSALAAGPDLAADDEEPAGAWGDLDMGDLDDGEAHGGEDLELEGLGGEEEGGWDELELEGLDGVQAAPLAASKAGLFVPPRPGPDPQEAWARSALAAEHAAAGAADSAMKLLYRQAGVVHFAPLRPFFLALRTAAVAACPLAAGMPAAPQGIERGEGRPALAVRLPPLIARLKAAYKATTAGSLQAALEHFTHIMHAVLFVVAASRDEEQEARELLAICREYATGLRAELQRRELAAAKRDGARVCELAAYFTHCQLQPPHLRLALRNAMVMAHNLKNHKLAALFARRLLELNPSADLSTKARKVVAFAERNPTDAKEIRYDDRNPFDLCCATYTPIYRGNELVRCPLCAAAYLPAHKGTLCTICGVAEVGREVDGLTLMPPRR